MTFMAGVKKTLAVHNLEMSEVEYAVMQKEEPVKVHVLDFNMYGLGKKRMIYWHRMLAFHIARAHFCETLTLDSKTNNLALIGRHHDRLIAEFMVVTIIRLCETLADKAYVREFHRYNNIGLPKMARGFRKSFIMGFTQRVCERYMEMEREQETEAAKGSGMSLIRLNQEKALVKQVTKDLTKPGEGVNATNVPTKVKLSGLEQGRQAGDNVNLKNTGLAAEQKVKSLGEGQKLLETGT